MREPGRTARTALEGVGQKVSADVGVEIFECQRVPGAGVDVVVLRFPGLGLGGAHREDGVHDMVAGHDVDDRFRRRRELGKLTAAVRQDQGLGHLEAFDPAWIRMQPGGLDDRRSNDRDVHVLSDIGHHPLAESLGEGVRVGPAQRAGPLGTGLDQLSLDPSEAAALCVGGCGQEAGLPVLALSLLAELRELQRGTRLRLDQIPHRNTSGGLGFVVDVVLMRRLGNGAPPATGRVRG